MSDDVRRGWQAEGYCQKHIPSKSTIVECPWCQIEHLRAIVDHNDDLKYLCDLQAENGELRHRIEELEDQLNEEMTFLSECDVIIPTDKIDAMWEYIEKLKIAGDDHCSSLAVAIKEVLALAGIVECEECGGSGVLTPDGLPDRYCPSCHGHKWRIKDNEG